MVFSPTILVFGRDPGLLATRVWVLQIAGYTVIDAAQTSQAEVVLASQPIDLLILCHTLSPAEAGAASAAAHTLQPASRILVLTTPLSAYLGGEQELFLNAFADPGTLLRTLARILAEPGPEPSTSPAAQRDLPTASPAHPQTQSHIQNQSHIQTESHAQTQTHPHFRTAAPSRPDPPRANRLHTAEA